LGKEEITRLVDRFPEQAIDFYGAMRSRMYDEQVRKYIQEVGIDRISKSLVNSATDKPIFTPPYISIARLIEFGDVILHEQKLVANNRLVDEYNLRLYKG
jgi:hypothetical protein